MKRSNVTKKDRGQGHLVFVPALFFCHHIVSPVNTHGSSRTRIARDDQAETPSRVTSERRGGGREKGKEAGHIEKKTKG